MDTRESLSLPHQRIDAFYISQVIDFCDAAVIDAPCESGT
jgi:hypothetical protein